MSATVTLLELINSKNVFIKLSKTEFDIKTAYRLSKLIKSLNEEYIKLEEFNQSLYKKYGRLDELSGKYIIKEEFTTVFSEEMNSLLTEEIEFDITKLKLSDLEKYDISISPIEIIAIEKFLE